MAKWLIGHNMNFDKRISTHRKKQNPHSLWQEEARKSHHNNGTSDGIVVGVVLRKYEHSQRGECW
jgi:hypothetical protein